MFKTYQEVEAFFASRKMLGIKPGLQRIDRMLALLDHPQQKVNAIHIAGTNGKGSTAQYIKNALQASGYQVGVFTSPSLTGLTGHIYLDDQEISEQSFLELCNEIHPVIKQLDRTGYAPTEFEIITALAFLYFSKNGDFALIEAGMGGREDTTNCFQPIISIITNVAKDHTKFLGDSLKEIAYHKAGIIKPGVPVVAGLLDSESLQVIVEEAEKRMTNLYRFGEDFSYEKMEQHQIIWSSRQNHAEMKLQMAGEHQFQNASVALMAIERLQENGYQISLGKATEAIATTRFPGRFESISTKPVIVIDGAHNPAGMEAFVKTVEEYYPESDKHLLFGAFKDKELDTMLSLAENQTFTTISLTSFDHPRATSAEELFRLSQAKGKRLVADWKQEIDEWLNMESGYYFVAGSLNFISRVRAYVLEKRNG
ncbi:bifunctional folylpolyglutamate synthase/dihydrofolate synthase [Oceanobacillus massiliensis]|uniref:bifunctional folylpolyglutamate synthase/dihydrofolate synthase n=1 Tax=Oceanobacillus massiliensis TaxID=1465765 RepID=UPI000289BCF4|nr:folylpolyglutamate synthase/dihydrofolate synthase family protein [Oceanobacillus massiliensis]